MDTRVETGGEFWRAVLRAGGATAIPRWTLDPAPGVAEHVATLDDDLAAGVRRLAYELELPLHSVALAAHAKVLAALSGEQDVVIGYAARPGGRPLPCPLTTEARSWRSLLQDTARVESDLLQHRDFAVDELKRELGVAGPGGTSLSAVRLAIALDRAVSLEDLTHHPVLADLAVLVDDRLETAPGVPCVTESVAPS
ncbi:hypothetical protein ACFO9E_33080 [Streptomyces maoxianensis]|uniref:Non-ribosomal peptide synthetase n=1 Tax=Streptomyces maoxianensis TaxID=1459942 RepID=A0ABV9GF11_9ACTN